MKDILLLGAGHAHVGVLRSFGLKGPRGARVTLITRETQTPYSGMLPAHIAGHYTRNEMHIDAAALSRFAGARFVLGEGVGIDLNARQVMISGGAPVRFDLLSIDIGSSPNVHAVPGAAEHALPVKPIGRFLSRLDEMRSRVMARAGLSNIAVVGGGAAGVELLLSVQHRLRRDFAQAGRSPHDLAFTLVTASEKLLPQFNARAHKYFSHLLEHRGVTVMLGRAVQRADAGRLSLTDETRLHADEILWVTEAAAAPWLGQIGLAVDSRGFIRVGHDLASISHPFVFAAGDIASIDGEDLPKSGVWAVREAGPLVTNLRNALAGRPLVSYRPQRRGLALISTGDKNAAAIRGWFFAHGRGIWLWKDWIDRRFMRRYTELPS